MFLPTHGPIQPDLAPSMPTLQHLSLLGARVLHLTQAEMFWRWLQVVVQLQLMRGHRPVLVRHTFPQAYLELEMTCALRLTEQDLLWRMTQIQALT